MLHAMYWRTSGEGENKANNLQGKPTMRAMGGCGARMLREAASIRIRSGETGWRRCDARLRWLRRESGTVVLGVSANVHRVAAGGKETQRKPHGGRGEREGRWKNAARGRRREWIVGRYALLS